MVSGLKALHEMDSAIAKARKDVSKASVLPGRAANALAEASRQMLNAYQDIAKVRLENLEDGADDEMLGYVDRQAEKLLKQHAAEEQRLDAQTEAQAEAIARLEARRRTAEKQVDTAVKAYEKAAALSEKKLSGDPAYQKLVQKEQDLQAMIERAQSKYELAEKDVNNKGKPYREDKYFTYLQKRHYGTKEQKGWFLTRLFDALLARRLGYREAALNYRRLTDIPRRLAAHVEDLQGTHKAAMAAVEHAEAEALKQDGVEDLKQASLEAQKALDAIDADIETAEKRHQDLRTELANVSAGQSEPYQKAISLIVDTLKRKDMPDLQRLVLHTISPDDDKAVETIGELSDKIGQLQSDQDEARRVLQRYQENLRELEKLRRRFKNQRYDAPTSQFPGGAAIFGSMLGQVLSGVLNSSDVWRQIERTQRTVRRQRRSRQYGGGFGGGDWGRAARLPRSPGDFGDIFGGGGGSAPRLPKIRLPRGGGFGGFGGGFGGGGGSSSGGGFRTGGGF